MITSLFLVLSLASGERIHPREEGVNLVFTPTRFAYKHEYKFENLKEEARSVYFLLPRNCQEHTITSATYTVAGKPLEYKVVSETPGWQVARAEVPLSRNFSVIMDVKGVHWNGKLSRERSQIPADIAPPPISDEKMKWYAEVNPFVSRVEREMRDHLEKSNLTSLGPDFLSAFVRAYEDMARHFQYKSGAAELSNAIKGKVMNCNGSNWWLEGVFEFDRSGAYVASALHGVIMGSGDIHAMSMIGKRAWSYLVPTDAVKFDDGNLEPYRLSGHSMGPMLLFQEGVRNQQGGIGVCYPVKQYDGAAEDLYFTNPGGTMSAFGLRGESLARPAGNKPTLRSVPVTDFDALRRELGIKPGGSR